MRAKAVVHAQGVCKFYNSGEGRIAAVDHIDFTIVQGEYVALVGPSGSGKSTLMHMIGCLDRPDEGLLQIDGQDTSAMDGQQLALMRQKAIGFVFQQFNLLPLMDARDNVALPLLYRGIDQRARRQQAESWLAKLGLGERLHHKPLQLSGGQQQRVAIARALVGAPTLLLADEPTGALDSQTSSEILDLFDQLHAQGATIIMVTHDHDVAHRAARQIALRDGHIVSDS